MTGRILLLAILLAPLFSCAHSVQTARRPRVPSSSVETVMHRQVTNAVDAGDGDYQVRALRRRMLTEPDNVEVRLELARHYERLGFPELAAEHYRLAAARFPDSEPVHLALARSLRSMGMTALAVEILDGFVGGHAQASADAWSWLGILQDELGNFARGEQAHRMAVKADPKKDYLYNNLGYNLLLQGRSQEAAEEFRRALKLKLNSEIARNNLGLALAAQPEEAILNWQSVSGPATAHNNLAAVLIERGRYAEARKELDIALGYRRDHPAALSNLKLVSELDGKPVTLPYKRPPSLWKRLGAGVKRALGAGPQQQTGAAQTASR